MNRIFPLTALLLASGAALSQEGALDPTYGTLGSGRVVYGFDLPANGFDSPAGLVVDAQGRAYTIGLSSEQNNTVWRATLARLTANGGLDNTFGIGGKVVSTDSPRRPAITAALSPSILAATTRTWRASSRPPPMAACT